MLIPLCFEWELTLAIEEFGLSTVFAFILWFIYLEFLMAKLRLLSWLFFK